MTGNDLIGMAPWIIFGAGLSALWSRLLPHGTPLEPVAPARHTTRHQAERSPRSYTDPAGSGGAAPGRRGRGSVPAAPRHNVCKTWRFGQKVPADGPVGVRELAGVGDLLPAARAQLHPDPADPLRAPSVRSALPAHQVRPGQAARLVRPARRLGRQYRQPGQDEAARGSYERGWPARPAGRGDGRDTRQRVGGKRQGWGCRVAYRIHRENPQPPGARAARHRDCFP
jgi:hypothetical protein